MNLSQIIRRKVFWSFDILKRNDIKNHYTDIKNILDQPNSDISRIKREEYLRQILTHAVSTTSFYKKYSDHNSILDFPIINKNMIRDNFDSFKSSNFTIEDCVVISTSGSTGAPFSILQNKNKKSRNTGDTLYFSKKSGYDIGYKLVYLKIWPDNFKTKFLSKLWWQNIVPKSVFKLSDGGIEEFIKELEKDSSKKSLIGYASSFATICKYLDEIKASPSITNVQSIITISEGLNDYVRDRVNTYFGVTPMSRYSNSENGILAQEESSKKSKFIINSASYYIEIFDMDIDTPVAHGNSGRIVITDLHNYAMPLIRYDTGDIGVMDLDEDNVPYLSSVEGRKLDLIYNTKGEIMPSSHISYKLCKYGNYKQFQLMQYGEKEYRIILNTDKKVDEEAMVKEYKEYFGQDAHIEIQYVDEIPLLSSGKRQEVVNTYHSNYS